MRKNLVTDFRFQILTVALTVLTAVSVLFAQGRIWWCKHGDFRLYVHDAWNSGHTSQHLFDPYTFTHVLHGVMFFWLARLFFKKLSGSWTFVIAIFAEAAWEVFENSAYIIDKYRQNTASLDYFGDSIANSFGDLLACALGFWVAAKLGLWKSLAFFLLVELVLMFWIRDGLLLNIFMLLAPSEAVREWQAGA
ncbi:MAG: DUF2585 family protein [Pyrinomonadaceae bacterium]